MSNTSEDPKPFTLADLKTPTTPAPIGNVALHIPTPPPSAHCPPFRSLPAFPELHIPTNARDADCQPSSEAEDAPMSPEDIAEGLRELAQRGVSLSGKKGRPIRAQYFLTARQAAMAQLTKLAVCFIAGRPVTQALVLRLALVLLFRTVTDALKDKKLAKELLEDLEIAQGAE